MAKRKTFSVPLSEELADGVLQLPLTLGGTTQPLRGWVAQMQDIQQMLNQCLSEHPLSIFVAERVMQDLSKRGSPQIIITPSGAVHLQVSYENPRPKKTPPLARAARKSTLPKLAELRKEAEELGVDISHLGRARQAIYQLLQEHRAAAGASKGPEIVIGSETDNGPGTIADMKDLDVDTLLDEMRF